MTDIIKYKPIIPNDASSIFNGLGLDVMGNDLDIMADIFNEAICGILINLASRVKRLEEVGFECEEECHL